MVYEASNYRKFLKQVAVERIKKNPSYSLRAMTQQLGLAPSTFSEVLKGKKKFSHETAEAVAAKIGLQGEEVDYFCLLVRMVS